MLINWLNYYMKIINKYKNIHMKITSKLQYEDNIGYHNKQYVYVYCTSLLLTTVFVRPMTCVSVYVYIHILKE